MKRTTITVRPSHSEVSDYTNGHQVLDGLEAVEAAIGIILDSPAAAREWVLTFGRDMMIAIREVSS